MSGEIADWKDKSKRFNQVADIYDNYRPSYPKEIIDKLIDKSGINTDSHILEIGAGSGKATELFVSRGYRLTCLEPGQDLVKLGKQKFESSGNVDYIMTRLEDWQVNKQSYDLAISAQAFHWVERPLGFKKMALALKEDCYIGLFWNMYLNNKSQFIDQLANLCLKYDINLLESKEKLTEIKQGWINELEESQYFSNLEVIEVPWSVEKRTQEFINFLSTSSEYIGLEPQAKEEFNNQLANIFSNAGGSLRIPFVSTLYLAQKNN